MARLIRAYDWASTPLGPIATWPQSLKTATGLLIAAPVPIVMLWGEAGVMLYNDAYSIFAGGRHPALLGSKVREGWPEVADFNDNVMKVGLAGGTLAYKDQELTLHRHGRPEQVWMNLDYWPVPGEDGQPAGVIATVIETTDRVRADRLRSLTNERLELALSAGRGVGTWEWDIAADRVVADARFAQLYGVDPAFARDGAPLADFFTAMHPDDTARVGREIAHAISSQEPFRSEYRLVQPDGEVRWVAAEGRVIPDADGKPARFPGVTFDVTDRRRTVAALAETEARYATLFSSITSGFCIIQMKFDEAMRPVDYKILEGNPAFEEMTGLRNANGKWVSEIAPGLEQHWFDLYGGVALTGEPVRFENPADIFGRWYDVEALRIGEPEEHRVAILFTNITERKSTEARQAALLELTDRLRDLTDASDIALASAEILGRALGVSRAGYGVMDTAAETIRIERDYNAPGVQSLAGLIHFRDYGSYIDELKRGEAVVIADAAQDPRTRDTADALAGISATALINLPLIEHGKVVALVFANHATARTWSEADVDLIREVAARVRTATERARSAAALRESEARFRNIADHTPMMMWVTDPDGRCTYLNRRWYEFTGQTEQEAEGYGWLDATHPDDRARAEAVFMAANAANEPFQLEYRLRRADGAYRWAIDAGSPRFDALGDYLGYVGSVIDIDDRREIEDALRLSESRLTFLDALGQATAVSHDADDVLAITTRMTAQHLGVSNCAYADMDADQDGFTIRGDWAAPGSPSIIGHYSLADFGKLAVQELGAGRPLIINDNLTEIAPEEAATFQAIGIGATICMPLVKDGKLTALMAVHTPGPHRWSDYELAVIREVTERSWAHIARVSAEAELRDSEARYRTLFETMDEGFCIIEFIDGPHGPLSDYVHVEANPAYAENTGIADPIGRKVRDMVGDEAQTWIDRYSEVLRTGQAIRFEQELKATGRWLELAAFRVEPASRNQVAVLFKDLTQKKLAEVALQTMNATLEERVEQRTQELQSAHEALRQSQKMEAVGQLTGGIAHDFNNLLAGISGSLELLSKRLAEGRMGGVERYIDAAQGSAQRAASLTQRLLAFSRRQTLDPRPIEANRLIGGMEDLIRRTMGPDIEVEVVGAAGLWTVRADPSQLENALLNLCINARDAMLPEPGRLTIETANKWLDDRAGRERELTPGQYVSLCVTDTGSGIAPEIRDKIFDPFFTTKPIGQGTGLGLSMIHGFVRQSGGQVRVYSEPGKGTTMCLYLPRYTGPLEAVDVLELDVGDHPGHGETILVIDDEPTVRMLAVEVLQDAGYAVIEAADGPSGLKILQSDVRIDLLISDVGLPGGMNGRQVADEARVSRPDLKVLFITGYAENAAVGNGLLDAGMAVLTKPFVMADLSAKVAEMIDA